MFGAALRAYSRVTVINISPRGAASAIGSTSQNHPLRLHCLDFLDRLNNYGTIPRAVLYLTTPAKIINVFQLGNIGSANDTI